MIISFGDERTEDIWNGIVVRKLPIEILNVARRKLRMINAATLITDLRVPPGNRLEKLSGGLADYYSIRVNDQWRIIFQWKISNASHVQLIDYH